MSLREYQWQIGQIADKFGQFLHVLTEGNVQPILAPCYGREWKPQIQKM
jgi:hypothetical protein